MISVQKIELGSPELEEAFAIREEVFVHEQEVDRDIEYEFEEESHHFLALVNGSPAGTARWRATSNGIKLERFAVLKNYRRLGVASALMTALLNDLGEQDQNSYVYLHAQEQVCDLYAKHGFKKVGPLFWEANIPHYKMVLKSPF